jgi:hypothetical protein
MSKAKNLILCSKMAWIKDLKRLTKKELLKLDKEKLVNIILSQYANYDKIRQICLEKDVLINYLYRSKK